MSKYETFKEWATRVKRECEESRKRYEASLEGRGIALAESGYCVTMLDDEGQYWDAKRLSEDYAQGLPRPELMGFRVMELDIYDPRLGTHIVVRRTGQWPCVWHR